MGQWVFGSFRFGYSYLISELWEDSSFWSFILFWSFLNTCQFLGLSSSPSLQLWECPSSIPSVQLLLTSPPSSDGEFLFGREDDEDDGEDDDEVVDDDRWGVWWSGIRLRRSWWMSFPIQPLCLKMLNFEFELPINIKHQFDIPKCRILNLNCQLILHINLIFQNEKSKTHSQAGSCSRLRRWWPCPRKVISTS